MSVIDSTTTMSGRTPFPLPPNPMAGSSSQATQPQVPYQQYANYGYGAYNPAFAFRQALFPGYQALPQTPAGYTYSSTYQPDASNVPAPLPFEPTRSAPSKRPRPQEPGVGPWRNCCQAGCAFTGPDETVSIHEGDRHLIFPRGKLVERSEEEERALKRGGSARPPRPILTNRPNPTIQGTSIRLDTEADIAAWIAERKARWPSKQKLEQEESDKRDRRARGEVEPSTRGKRGGRGGRGRAGRTDATSRAEDWGRPEVGRTDVPSAPSRGRGRGRGRGGATTSTRIQHIAAESDSDSSSDSSSSSDSESDSESDVEAALPAHIPAPVAEAVKQVRPPSKRPCKYFQQRGKCRNGDSCNFSHDVSNSPPQFADQQVKVNQPRAQVQAAKPSLLGSVSLLFLKS